MAPAIQVSALHLLKPECSVASVLTMPRGDIRFSVSCPHFSDKPVPLASVLLLNCRTVCDLHIKLQVTNPACRRFGRPASLRGPWAPAVDGSERPAVPAAVSAWQPPLAACSVAGRPCPVANARGPRPDACLGISALPPSFSLCDLGQIIEPFFSVCSSIKIGIIIVAA